MKKEEILRLLDSIHRDKAISKEILFEGLEDALMQATAKVMDVEMEEVQASIDRISGQVNILCRGEKVDINSGELGRIAAQTAKHALKTKILEAERDMIVKEFSDKIRTLTTVEVLRKERGNIVVQVQGHAFEAIIPREEQVPTERYRTGDRLRCFIVSVNERSAKASLILSRAKPELVHELFITNVPEIADGIIEVMELSREPGFRTKLAVHCNEPRIDCVGACVGTRGTRIRNIINELGGEKIDIIRWSEIPETFIQNSLAPARVSRVYLDLEARDAIVVVPDDQLSLAIGKRGQNVRLTCRLTRFNVDVKSETEFAEENKGETEGDSPIEGSSETKGESDATEKSLLFSPEVNVPVESELPASESEPVTSESSTSKPVTSESPTTESEATTSESSTSESSTSES